MNREELHKLIDQLPEDKLEVAFSALINASETLASPSPEKPPAATSAEDLHKFLDTFTSTIGTVLYDLSETAKRSGDKVSANRYDFSRKKITENWMIYSRKTLGVRQPSAPSEE